MQTQKLHFPLWKLRVVARRHTLVQFCTTSSKRFSLHSLWLNRFTKWRTTLGYAHANLWVGVVTRRCLAQSLYSTGTVRRRSFIKLSSKSSEWTDWTRKVGLELRSGNPLVGIFEYCTTVLYHFCSIFLLPLRECTVSSEVWLYCSLECYCNIRVGSIRPIHSNSKWPLVISRVSNLRTVLSIH